MSLTLNKKNLLINKNENMLLNYCFILWSVEGSENAAYSPLNRENN